MGFTGELLTVMREFLALVPLFVLLAWAAATDVRTRRIPNWLTGSLALAGLLQSALGLGIVGLAHAAAGLCTGFALTFVFFALGGMGAGDVKLFAGIGAWLGPLGVIQVFVVERVVGILVVVVQAARSGRLAAVARGSALLVANAVATRDFTCPAAPADGAAAEKQTRLPYAVPTLIAVALVLTARWRGM